MKDTGAVETKMFIRSRAGTEGHRRRRRRSADDSAILAAIESAGGDDIQIGDAVSSTDILGSNGNKIGTCIDDVCTCVDGFDKNDRDECTDINECIVERDTVCGGPLAGSCFNNDGSFSCNCNGGFEKDSDSGECKDIDECATGSHACAIGAGEKCDNEIGAFKCTCEEGYKLGY